MKPDALAHLADALMEDIVAAPPYRLAIEELADSRRSRDLMLRFDDILAETDAMTGGRGSTMGAGAMWNLADALCEDIAAQPPSGFRDDAARDRGLAGAFDEIVRRHPRLATGSTRPRRAVRPRHPVSPARRALAKLAEWLAVRLVSRAAAGALATMAAAAVVTAAVHEYGAPRPERTAQKTGRQLVEWGRAEPGSEGSSAAVVAVRQPAPAGSAGARPAPVIPAPAAPMPRAAAGDDDDAVAAAPVPAASSMAVSKARAPAAGPSRAEDDPDAYFDGDSVPRDPVRGVYLDAEGVAGDPVRGPRWLYQAAGRGQYEAQAMLGALLFKGFGTVVPRDGAKGLMWLKIAFDSAPQGVGGIRAAYDAAWRQATDDERAAAAVLLERWRSGRMTPASAP